VTFKDLQRVVESQIQQREQQQTNQELGQLLQRIRASTRGAFWYWDQNQHKTRDRVSKGDCCFNHIIGLPRKDGIEKPMFDYEREIFYGLLKPGYFNSYPRSRSDFTQSRVLPRHKSYTEDDVLYPFKEKHLWIKKATASPSSGSSSAKISSKKKREK
jgi:hypothetical protein